MLLIHEMDFNKHPTFTLGSEAKDLISSQNIVPCQYLCFEEFFPDGSHARLTTHPDWIANYYQSGLYKQAIFESFDTIQSNTIIWWNSLCKDPIYTAAEQFGISNGFTYLSKTKDSTKLYHIGNLNQKIPKDAYTVSKFNLMRFENQFLTHSKILREIAYGSKILYQKPAALDALSICSLASNNCLNGRIYFKQTELDFDPKFANVAVLLMNGKSLEEAAMLLNISLRTLNNWIKQLKILLDAKTLPQLMYHLSKIYLGD